MILFESADLSFDLLSVLHKCNHNGLSEEKSLTVIIGCAFQEFAQDEGFFLKVYFCPFCFYALIGERWDEIGKCHSMGMYVYTV